MKHKVAFIGPKAIYDGFENIFTNWDLQAPMESIKDFNDELEKENSRISADETAVIIILSTLFNKNPKEFSEFVAYFSPYAAVCILIPETHIERYKNDINKQIKAAQYEASKEVDSYNYNTPFYFVKYEDAELELEDALSQYVDSEIIDDSIKEIVQPIVNDMRGIEDFEEDTELDEITLDFSENEEGPGKVITFTSSKGGAGKSTMSLGSGAYLKKASEIAYEQGLRDRPLKIITMDLDVKDGQLSHLNGVKSPNIVNIYSSESDLRNLTIEDVRKGIYHNERSGVDFIFAPKVSRNGEQITPAFYLEVIKILKKEYDYIILDTSVNYLEPLLSDLAYPIADKIVLVTDMGISSLMGINKWIKEFIYRDMRENKVDKDIVGIVINKFMPDTGVDLTDIQKAANGVKILSFVPNSPRFITTKANKLSLDEIINNKGVNKAIEAIVKKTLPDEILADVPVE